MVPSVRLLCPDGVNQFQKDKPPMHNSCMVQECLQLQANVKLDGRPSHAPTTGPI